MTRYSFNQACSAARTSHNRRRPAGVSRRLKHRQLQFESLEDRRVMSANPVTQAVDDIMVLTREQALSDEVLNAFERSSNLTQYTDNSLLETQDWVVLVSLGGNVQTLSETTGINVAGATGIIPDTYIVNPGEAGVEAMIDSLSTSEEIDYFYPLMSRVVSPLAAPNDPYLQYQWHLINIGQDTGSPDFSPFFGTPGEDINASGAWESGVTGAGVQIAIVDEGIEVDHPDLIDNYRPDLDLDLGFGFGFFGNHGTTVAGLAAGTGNNGLGTTGVAYEADFSSINLLDSFATDFALAQTLVHEFQEIDIYNHSWGPNRLFDGDGDGEPDFRNYIEVLGPLSTTALRNSVFFGRGGLGSIHVVASGNDAELNVSSQYNSFTNSRYTIAVSGVDETGALVASAEGGANVLVAAPTGTNPSEIIRDSNLGSGIWTTDRTGDDGYNVAPTPGGFEFDNDYFEDTDYSSRFAGTSASAPIVSGVIALMLEANPTLTYRDVQSILVVSARQNDPGDAGWITNVRELQHDPVRSAAPDGVFSHPDSAWPFAPVYNIERFQDQFANGAGYTVNQGYGFDEFLSAYKDSGFGHGIIDAGLAVEMARNWNSVGGQTSEYTWTTTPLIHGKIWNAIISSDETFNIRVPGGVTGDGDDNLQFEEYYNEWGKLADPEGPQPFEDDEGEALDPGPRDDRDFGGTFRQPGIFINNPTGMSVEWVEVELDFGVSDINDLDFLRIVLVSPEGTQSELSVFGTPTTNGVDHFDGIGVASDAPGNMGTSTMVLTTNRLWGERSEGRYRVGEYLDREDYDGDDDKTEILNRVITDKEFSSPVFDNWRLVFENYGENEINIWSYEVAFHGANVSGTGRIQGAVGVDDNGDGVFSDLFGIEDNFSRYLYSQAFSVNDAANRFLNFGQESWATGAIVYADLDHNGFRDPTDPHFQVGADGNYYFDLLAGGTYDLRIDPTSLEYAGLGTVANFNLVNAGPFATVTVDAAGQRILNQSFLDLDGVDFNIKGNTDLNFLFDPPPEAPNTIDLSGIVYADLDSNGVKNGTDFSIVNADIYVDINQNGVYSPGIDYLATTDANGEYSFKSGENGVPSTTESKFYIVKVIGGTTGPFGIPSEPVPLEVAVAGEYGLFFDFQIPDVPGEPGYFVENLDFGFGPGAGPGGGSSVGSISGTVFDDANGNGIWDPDEGGAQNAANVYLDEDGDNMRGPDEPVVMPGANGSYAFGALAPDTYNIRIEFSSSHYTQTTPSGFLNPDGTRINEDDWEYEVVVTAGSITQDLDFGLDNKAILDYGDLPDIYGTTSAAGGATHVVFGDLFLGDIPTDAELDAPPLLDGSGDDVTGSADEDGITFSTLFNGSAPSTTMTVTVDANVDGGYLQGWIDFNADGIFQVSERLFDDVLLPSGESVFEVAVPANLTGGGGTVYARFRYGEEGIDSPVGAAIKGEVEDYAIPVVSNAIDPGPQAENGPDFDDDGDIDGFDFLSWQLGFGAIGAVGASDGDSDNDNDVDTDDLSDWEAGFGTVVAPAVAPATSGDEGEASTTAAPAVPVEPIFEPVVPTEVVLPAETTEVVIATSPVIATSAGQPGASVTHGGRGTQVSASSIRIEHHVDHRIDHGPADIASLASAMESFNETGLARLRGVSGPLFESHVSATTFDQSVDAEDLGFALRDRALDNLFAKRQRSLEDRIEQLHEREFEIEDAFATALGEEIDWRFS